MPLPLHGIRVVDFSRVLAGPHCAKTLLDLGAEVIKIEPPAGDLSRRAFPNADGISGYYTEQNAGPQRDIDLNVPGARDAIARLCDTADVTVENFRPGALAAFGLDYESVSARNPRVDYASISGYGQHGPWRSRMAYAPTVQAETGITATTAEHFRRAGELRSDSLSHADVYSGLHAAIAILACLTERERTGQGRTSTWRWRPSWFRSTSACTPTCPTKNSGTSGRSSARRTARSSKAPTASDSPAP